MSRETDQAELTAYALGELPADQAEAVQRRLADDPAARLEVDEIRALAGVLAGPAASAHAADAPPRLTVRQRQAVLDGPTATNQPPRLRFGARQWGGLAAAAAVIAAIAVGWITLHRAITETQRDDLATTPEKKAPAPPPTPPRPGDPGFEHTPGVKPPISVHDAAPPRLEYVPTPRNIPPAPGSGRRAIVRFRSPVLVPPSARNLAADRPVSSSEPDPIAGDIAWITDGDKDPDQGLVELGPGLHWVQIDLGRPLEIHAVVVWHCFLGQRVYRDVIVHAGDHPDFIDPPAVLYNNDADNSAGLGLGTDREYLESNKPLVVAALGTRARFVRLYSGGNTTDLRNHYTEVEIYARRTPAPQPAGKPVPLIIEAPARHPSPTSP